LLAVDLGMPRNLDPKLGGRGDVTIVDLDRLRPLARSDPELERAAELAARRASEDWAREALEPWTDAVRRRAERIRREEWAGALAHLPEGLTEAQRRVLERMTRRLVNRLWVAPTTRLRRLPATPDAAEARRLALALFEESDPDSP
jgi:glutamyl-tRNA reductase